MSRFGICRAQGCHRAEGGTIAVDQGDQGSQEFLILVKGSPVEVANRLKDGLRRTHQPEISGWSAKGNLAGLVHGGSESIPFKVADDPVPEGFLRRYTHGLRPVATGRITRGESGESLLTGVCEIPQKFIWRLRIYAAVCVLALPVNVALILSLDIPLESVIFPAIAVVPFMGLNIWLLVTQMRNARKDIASVVARLEHIAG